MSLFGGVGVKFSCVSNALSILVMALAMLFGSVGYAQEAAPPAASDTPSEAPAATEPAPSESAESAAEPYGVSDGAIADTSLAAHNTWMLISCALVLFMTAPGLALFYGGLVRRKNVLSVMMQCFFLMGIMTVVWALYGYSLAFGGSGSDNPYFGNGDYLFMQNVQRMWDTTANEPLTPMEGLMPRLTHMLFQGMFFIITPALICGAFAERMKFSAMVVYSVLWGTFIYCPLTHWVWDGGLLAFNGDHALMGGALDFAGGTVVHISSGVSALIAAIMIGPRMGFGREPMPPHNLTYTAIGAAMLWFGWFGFNAGSELASDGLTASAFAVTHFSAAAGAVAWPLVEWLRTGKPTLLGSCSGAVAGLVCITPAAGFVQPMPSLLMGALAGIVCYFACSALKHALGYDDALDAFGVHGVGGTLGALLTGVFATRACWNIDSGNPLGLIEGNSKLIIGQTVAVLVTYLFAAVGSVVLLLLIKATIGLRATKEDEQRGLDLTQHGEEGYIFQ
jgi:Amt family ammonium transporter